MRILAISGSLRAASSNAAILRAAGALAPERVAVALYAGLGELPHFNPDLDVEPAPPAVARFREALRAADALLISSPEYAHGVPGSLKNALDWLVGSGELVEKPVGLISSSRSAYSDAALREILTVMTAALVPDASIKLELWTNRVDEAALLANEEVSGALRAAVAALAEVARGS